jgi:hypothetical protein
MIAVCLWFLLSVAVMLVAMNTQAAAMPTPPGFSSHIALIPLF